MNIKTFGRIKLIVCIAIGIIFAVSIWFGNWIAPVAAIVVAMIIMGISMSRLKDVVSDERTVKVAHRAAYFTMSLGTICMAIIGTILLAINRDALSSSQAQIGFTLLFATCGLMVINSLAYTYNNRKLGGRE